MPEFDIDHAQLDSLCRMYHVKRLALFESRLCRDESAASDLDLLVEFEEDKTPALVFFRLQCELSTLLYLLFLTVSVALCFPLRAQQHFVAHEWGTFTTLAGSDGTLLPGLYHEEERLPVFVDQFSEE